MNIISTLEVLTRIDMNNNQSSVEEWDEIKLWLRSLYEAGVQEADYNKYETKVMEAIHSLLSAERNRNLKERKHALGFMRQWLNEDRITDVKKMVTDEQLNHWFDYQSKIKSNAK